VQLAVAVRNEIASGRLRPGQVTNGSTRPSGPCVMWVGERFRPPAVCPSTTAPFIPIYQF